VRLLATQTKLNSNKQNLSFYNEKRLHGFMLLSTVVLISHQPILTTVAITPSIRPIRTQQSNVLLRQTRNKLAPRRRSTSCNLP
jgi:hypothetical protein